MQHVTFSYLDYARDFGSISKESAKRSTKWAAKYYTYRDSYYPIAESNTLKLEDIDFMKHKETSEVLSKDQERQMYEYVEEFRPLRQRTVRDETTKDKAGTMPIILYQNQKTRERSNQ